MKKKTKKKKKKTKTKTKKKEEDEGCVSKDLCGGLLTHPLKFGHREGEPWSGKLLRSRLASRLLSLVPIRLLSLHPPGFFPYTHLPSFPSDAYPRPQ